LCCTVCATGAACTLYCSSGDTLSGTNCHDDVPMTSTQGCDSGWTKSGSECTYDFCANGVVCSSAGGSSNGVRKGIHRHCRSDGSNMHINVSITYLLQHKRMQWPRGEVLLHRGRFYVLHHGHAMSKW
jgi:hypothetical protein